VRVEILPELLVDVGGIPVSLQKVKTPDRMILLGLRGAGKTVCGRKLSEIAGAGFVDTDDLVERAAGLTVAQIFEKEGEKGFRKRERRAVAQLSGRPVPEVVATGGGVVLSEANRQALSRLGVSVYLRAPAQVLAGRVASAPDTGSRRPPLLGTDPAGEMEALTTQREPLYLETAHVVVESDRPVDQVVQRLLALWQSLRELHSVQGD
jgi:shikimate kinase